MVITKHIVAITDHVCFNSETKCSVVTQYTNILSLTGLKVLIRSEDVEYGYLGMSSFGSFLVFSFLFASARYPKMKEEYLERQGENGEMNAQGRTL